MILCCIIKLILTTVLFINKHLLHTQDNENILENIQGTTPFSTIRRLP
jgi:hypothetical protein